VKEGQRSELTEVDPGYQVRYRQGRLTIQLGLYLQNILTLASKQGAEAQSKRLIDPCYHGKTPLNGNVSLTGQFISEGVVHGRKKPPA